MYSVSLIPGLPSGLLPIGGPQFAPEMAGTPPSPPEPPPAPPLPPAPLPLLALLLADELAAAEVADDASSTCTELSQVHATIAMRAQLRISQRLRPVADHFYLGLELLPRVLQAVQPRIDTVDLEQLFVSTLLDDATVVQAHDAVGGADRG